MVRKNNARVDIAILKTDLNWIKKKLNAIDLRMADIQENLQTNDERLSRLEEWKEVCEANFNRSLTRIGLMIAGFSVLVSFLVTVLG